jgi:hypothetical protein
MLILQSKKATELGLPLPATPTVVFAPTNTIPVIPPVPGPATLGGELGNFVARFGQPTGQSYEDPNTYYFASSAYGATYGIEVYQLSDLDEINHPYVDDIYLSATYPVGWTTSEAGMISDLFLPFDSSYVEQSLLYNTSNDIVGINFHYTSATLARALGTLAKANPGDQELLDNPKGEFQVNYTYGVDSLHVCNCEILLDSRTIYGTDLRSCT